MGQHHMDICGEGRAVGRSHLLRLATEGGMATKTAGATIDRMLALAASFPQRVAAYPIHRATVRRMTAMIDRCCGPLMRG